MARNPHTTQEGATQNRDRCRQYIHRRRMDTPENTAKQNQTDETGEAKLNIIHKRRETIKIKCKLDKTENPMESEHREMRQTQDTRYDR